MNSPSRTLRDNQQFTTPTKLPTAYQKALYSGNKGEQISTCDTTPFGYSEKPCRKPKYMLAMNGSPVRMNSRSSSCSSIENLQRAPMKRRGRNDDDEGSPAGPRCFTNFKVSKLNLDRDINVKGGDLRKAIDSVNIETTKKAPKKQFSRGMSLRM